MTGLVPVGASTLRRLAISDLEELVELMAAHAAYEETPFCRNGKVSRLSENLLGECPRAQCWVVVRNDRLIGYATYSREFSTWDAGDYLHLDTLFVQSGFRGHGLGARLLSKAAEEAARLGLKCLQWQTPDTNLDAIRFYRRLGAQDRGKVRFTLRVSG